MWRTFSVNEPIEVWEGCEGAWAAECVSYTLHVKLKLSENTVGNIPTNMEMSPSYRSVQTVVPGGGGKARNPKHPVVKGWLDVTPEQSAELARHAKYQKGPFIYFNGKDHGINDGRSRPKGSWETRPHVQKDGVEYWDEHFKDSGHMKYAHHQDAQRGVSPRVQIPRWDQKWQVKEDVLIDILADGKGMCFGPGYAIAHRVRPLSPPDSSL